ncbi:hypothetical protein HQ39_04540 [Porphyromonas sp. COT-108 OH2963]|uniref:hypothetical protein n=1 Tax=Porphyromonas sp. COT-108 OH2963 TaxID=1515614 RepID=UPI00052D26D0|nr:hypothetical protein [Porphyromonas sp. COT-108 OH2963]KGN95532.1 hypothetical protein HQ39_04540 [Porphyromonas sp. COT-108 OH2963]
MIKKTLFSFFALLLTLTVYSCSDLNFHLPPGPKGGDGKSVYEIWKEQVELGKVKWPKDRVSMADFLIYIKGEKGDKGENGKSAYELWKELIAKGNTPNPHNPSEMWPVERNTEADFWDFITGRDGNTPYVGENGNWWIGGKDTGVLARGKDGIDGKNGLSAYELWKQEVLAGRIDWPKDKVEISHFFQYLKGKDGKDGKDGVTPHIGPNGNWWFGDEDTGVPAKGKDGKDGVAGVTPHIGENGNWWIGDKDTGVPAKGKDGKDGQDGQDGVTPHIGENGNWWIGDKDTGVPAKGKDGQDGQDGVTPHIGENGNWWIGDKDTGVPAKGKDGKDGKDGTSPHIGHNGNWWIGDKDTGVPAQGEKGKDGADGLSAYQLWVKDVKAGKITDPETGNPWPVDKITLTDFWKYLRGAKGDKGEKGNDGKDGLSAYEIWKQMVLKDQIKDPNNPTQNWPKTKVDENHFWEFLTGKNGVDGLSAYALWKKELEERFDGPKPLMNYRTGEKWPKEKNSMDDFFDYLRGKDGKDGKDGKPGEPGKPGAEITILAGAPNVIAQYTQINYSEYVSVKDGSVQYRVYDKEGKPAPGAVVTGLPGMAETKSYTADHEGYFTVEKEDLPEIQDVQARWGKVKSVTIQGQPAAESAPNTYVPNRIRTRIIFENPNIASEANRPILSDSHVLGFRIQRKVDPNGAWVDLPSYLPDLTNIVIASYLTNGNDPKTITNQELASIARTTDVALLPTKRYVMTNKYEFKNSYPDYWDGTKKYFSVKQKTSYYGENPQWNGVCEMAPYQAPPTIKCLTLKTENENLHNEVFFSSVRGQFNYDDIKLDSFYRRNLLYNAVGGVDYVTPDKMPKAEAQALTPSFAYFHYKAIPGQQTSGSDKNPAGPNQTSYTSSTVYLGSTIFVKTLRNSKEIDKDFLHLHPTETKLGVLLKGSAGYHVQNEKATLPKVTVTYEN